MKLKTIALISCMLFAANVGAETVEKTINVVFSDYTAGVQNAINEKHNLGDGLVIYTNNCWFTDQLRIYSNPTMGYVVSEPLLGTLTNVTLNAAASDKNSTGKFEVYGSVDGSSWDLIKVVSFNSTSYANYRITFSKELNYKCFKIGIASTSYGANLRLKSMSVTFLEEIVDTYDIAINKYGYATLYLDMPYTMPEGSTAYYCTTSGEVARLLPIEGVVPAHTGVIIEAAPNTTCTLTYSTETNPAEESIKSDNQLIGYTEDTEVAFEDYSYYALNASKDGKVGFYIPKAATETSFTSKAYKAYLQVPKGQGASMFVIQRADDETQIIPMTATTDDVTYDLQGRRVAHPTAGIYIKGGKKIVIR